MNRQGNPMRIARLRPALARAAAIAVLACLCAGSSAQTAAGDAARTIVALQPWRQASAATVGPLQATLVNLNPAVNAWFVLTLDDAGRRRSATYHLENASPRQQVQLNAAGAIPATHALAVLALLWLGTIAAAAALPVGYRLVLAAYVALMLAYVLRVHDLRAADALLLGCGYTLRIVAGSAALGIAVSAWLLICSTLLFFSLALLKRYAELAPAGAPVDSVAQSHGYQAADAPMVAAVGRVAGAAAMAVLALYALAEPAVHQGRWLVWGGCLLTLYWMQRLWRLAGQGRIRDDPVMFALKDRHSLAVGAIVLAMFVAAA